MATNPETELRHQSHINPTTFSSKTACNSLSRNVSRQTTHNDRKIRTSGHCRLPTHPPSQRQFQHFNSIP